jgi:Holliday junction resolvase RusA-like endonuclease
MIIKFIIPGEPKPKQSARFRNVKGKGDKKDFIMSYQTKKVLDNASDIGKSVLSQLPLGFVPYDEAIGVSIKFVFPPLKSWNKAMKDLFKSGVSIYKVSKPDVDNLQKSVFDAMNGIVYIDDSRVARVEVEKVYGIVPRIEVEFYPLNR